MANYSTDAQMEKIDCDILQWLGERADYSDIRNMVTTRLNSHIKKQGWWDTLDAMSLISDGMVDTAKLLNAEDLEDIENTWVREILYFDNALSIDDLTMQKGIQLHRERLRLLGDLKLLPDTNSDGVADAETIRVTKLHRS